MKHLGNTEVKKGWAPRAISCLDNPSNFPFLNYRIQIRVPTYVKYCSFSWHYHPTVQQRHQIQLCHNHSLHSKCKEFANLVQKFVLGKKFNQNVADFEDDEVLVPIKELLVVCLNNTPGSYGVGRDNTNYKLYYLIFTNIFFFFFTIEGKEQEEARNKDDPCKS